MVAGPRPGTPQISPAAQPSDRPETARGLRRSDFLGYSRIPLALTPVAAAPRPLTASPPDSAAPNARDRAGMTVMKDETAPGRGGNGDGLHESCRSNRPHVSSNCHAVRQVGALPAASFPRGLTTSHDAPFAVLLACLLHESARFMQRAPSRENVLSRRFRLGAARLAQGLPPGGLP
ncbi:hypothetical protein LCGC14_1814920 [marine sediment metagenome]|uniref:Uncharacterized protein n=1 Tax=marine sediment metagenome TaxID=412755 RepID=A0A0F9GKR7_9ZZZZ